MKLEELMNAAVERHASDILLTPGAPAAIRVHGTLQLATPPLDPAMTEEIVRRMIPAAKRERLRTEFAVDFALEFDGRRYRCQAYTTRRGVALALRLLPAVVGTPEQLGLPKALVDLVQRPQGLLLFTGATGQGKSTSQAALIHWLNQNTQKHIITVEDPIEFVHDAGSCLIEQREVGEHVGSFGDALRQTVRENPEVILLGEMRDLDAIRAALQLAETGHLLMSTLHTNDAAQGIDRIVGAFPTDSQAVVRMQLSMSLLGIVNQRLLPSLGGGRVLAAELLLNTFAVGNLIREGRTDQLHNAMELDSESGMLTLSRSLDALVARGVLDAAEADRARPRLFQGRRTPGHP
jgi:twitching motility protein PilT